MQCLLEQFSAQSYSLYMNKNTPHEITFDDQFAETMFALGKRVRQRMDEEMCIADLSGVQMWALRILVEASESGERLGISQLAEKMHSGRSAATQLIDRMVTEQLVQRVQNPSDRRGVHIEITGEGLARYEQGKAIHRRVNSELLAHLSNAERDQLLHLLRKMLNQP